MTQQADRWIASLSLSSGAHSRDPSARNDEERHTFAISPHVFARGIHLFHALSNQRAQGKPDARCTRGLVCKLCKKHAHEHTGPAEAIRLSLRSGFTAYHALSPAIRPGIVTVIGGALTADLTPALRRQDHTLLPSASHAIRQRRDPRPPHPRPTSVTIANAPLSGTGFRKYRSDLGQTQVKCSGKQKYFVTSPGGRLKGGVGSASAQCPSWEALTPTRARIWRCGPTLPSRGG
jgi:hypothetical protein